MRKRDIWGDQEIWALGEKKGQSFQFKKRNKNGQKGEKERKRAVFVGREGGGPKACKHWKQGKPMRVGTDAFLRKKRLGGGVTG